MLNRESVRTEQRMYCISCVQGDMRLTFFYFCFYVSKRLLTMTILTD